MLVKGESCTDRLHSPQHLQSFMGELSRLKLLTTMHGHCQASSRTFLIQRGPDQMDPDPKMGPSEVDGGKDKVGEAEGTNDKTGVDAAP